MSDTVEFAYDLIRKYISSLQNPVIFELGMCNGDSTEMLLSWCNSQPIYHGFEPDPRNVARISTSNLPQRIIFNSSAVGHVTGSIPFYMATPEPGNDIAGSSSISEFTHVLTDCWPWLKCQETVDVWCWRLDDYCKVHKISHIDFIWMDVQGSERFVFDGAPIMLSKTKMVWTEYDGGTLYKDSSTIKDVLARFPGWSVEADCGGDVLLKNPLQITL